MKKYTKEVVLLILQMIMFYVFPLTAGPTDAMGMVFLILASVFTLSVIVGVILDRKIKFLYPLVIAILFIPSVFIYYNESAFIHAVWYFVIGSIGVLSGAIIRRLVSGKW